MPPTAPAPACSSHRLPAWLGWLAAASADTAGRAPSRRTVERTLEQTVGQAAQRQACHAPGAAETEPADAEAADDIPPRGCGWFDSSLDLQRGLQVQEHSGVAGLAEALPAAHWLAFELGVTPGATTARQP